MDAIPWLYSNTSGTPTNWAWSALNTYNQHAAAVTGIPANCAITYLKVFAAARSSTVYTRLCLWNPGGSMIRQTSTFTMAVGSESGGGQYWYTKTIDYYTFSAGGTLWVGLYRNPSGGHIFGTMTGSGDGFRKTNTSGFPSVKSMTGWNVDSNDEPTVALFYITAPGTPSSAAVSRVSDTKHTVTWTINSSADQPAWNHMVERWDNVTNGWYHKATLSSSANSYSDTTTIANREYRYRVKAWNGAGNSSYSTTSYINTTPAAPTSVVATRVTTTVEITWSNPATSESGLTIQRKTSTDGVSWSSYSTLSSSIAADETSYTDNSPANYNQYQVRADDDNPALHSNYVESNIVIVIQPPDAPTGLDPDNDEAIDADEANTFTFTHNPLDGTEQSKFSIRYRAVGDSWPGTPQANEVASSVSSYSWLASTFTNGTDYEWQVQTWGEHATASDWSATATFKAVSTPVATITSPSAVSDYGLSTLTMEWDYTQAESEGQTQYIATLKDSNDNILETRNYASSVAAGASGSTVFGYALENETTYKVTLQVKCTSELWSEETEVEFDTDFYVPPTPTISLELDEDVGGINVTITNPSPTGDEVEAVSNSLYRSVDSGDWELVEDEIDINTTVTDYLPSIGGNTNYYVNAVSATPTVAASSESDLDVEMTGYFFLNGGDGYGDYAKLRGDISYNEDFGRETVTRGYEGRDYPVKYQGTNLNQVMSFSCDLPKEDYSTLKTLIETAGEHFFRGWNGRYMHCSITGAKITRKSNTSYQFSCILERTEVENGN